MDLYLIAHICATVALLAFLAAAFLLWIDSLRDTRAIERQAREAIAAANTEISRRPRVPAVSSHLPTLDQCKVKS